MIQLVRRALALAAAGRGCRRDLRGATHVAWSVSASKRSGGEARSAPWSGLGLLDRLPGGASTAVLCGGTHRLGDRV